MANVTKDIAVKKPKIIWTLFLRCLQTYRSLLLDASSSLVLSGDSSNLVDLFYDQLKIVSFYIYSVETYGPITKEYSWELLPPPYAQFETIEELKEANVSFYSTILNNEHFPPNELLDHKNVQFSDIFNYGANAG